MKLKTKLLSIFVLLVFLPTMVFLIMYYSMNKADSDQANEAYGAAMLEQVCDTFNQSLNEVRTLIEFATDNASVLRFLEYNSPIARIQMQYNSSMISACSSTFNQIGNLGCSMQLISFNQQKYYMINKNRSAFRNYSQEHTAISWVQNAISQGTGICTQTGGETESFTFAMTWTCFDTRGDAAGLLAVFFDERFFKNCINSSTLEDGVAVFDENGICLFSTIPAEME